MPKGVKQCSNPTCKAEIRGCRTLTCPTCKQKIGVSLEEREVQARKILVLPDGYAIPVNTKITVVHTPSGKCPLRFTPLEEENPTEDDVVDWAMNLRQKMLTERSWYFSNAALSYWARQLDVPTELRSNLKNLPDYSIKTDGVAIV